MRKILLACMVISSCYSGRMMAQNRIYTVLEAGGMLGLNQQSDLGGNRLNGYKFHLMIGKNFNDKFYLGFGLGNEVYKAKKSDTPFTSRFSLLPFLADFRIPIDRNFLSGTLSLIANLGYAPRIGNDMFRGGLAQGGVNIAYPLTFNGPDLSFTLGYGLQQIVLPYQANNLRQQSISLTVGIFIN